MQFRNGFRRCVYTRARNRLFRVRRFSDLDTFERTLGHLASPTSCAAYVSTSVQYDRERIASFELQPVNSSASNFITTSVRRTYRTNRRRRFRSRA